ncbi:hypothetical protein IF1G_06531 [Cordyceps javanica]|uniref:Uncharacterized protein n=1 Tax=Cordyceps javanica TaxID=43265 RepID=A0A545UYG3_9HYPO|nr:hypothetical protein IF1G_06531 [Cordyceps javanica]
MLFFLGCTARQLTKKGSIKIPTSHGLSKISAGIRGGRKEERERRNPVVGVVYW